MTKEGNRNPQVYSGQLHKREKTLSSIDYTLRCRELRVFKHLVRRCGF